MGRFPADHMSSYDLQVTSQGKHKQARDNNLENVHIMVL